MQLELIGTTEWFVVFGLLVLVWLVWSNRGRPKPS